MQEHTINVARSAKYCQLGEISGRTEQLWFVCHGYGQLARYFIQNFECLLDENTVIIAPEALSRFYLNGFSGRVGASWITKVDRLLEIDDYVAYLDDLYKKITAGHDASSIKLTILGFSQGATTASRWITQGNASPSRLILWAGALPSEIDSKKALETFSNIKMILVYGTEDEFIKPAKLDEVTNFFTESGIELEVHSFVGGHKIDEEILLELKN